MTEKEIRRELRRVRHREKEILARNRYAKGVSLESLLNKYIPDKLEGTLDAAFREAFRVIFARGTAVIEKTFNERRLRKTGGSEAEAQRQWAKDILLTGVEGTGLGLIGVGLPDIAVFTGMLLRGVYQTAASNQFEFTSKTEQVFILRLIEAALTRGKEAQRLSDEVDEMMRKIDEEDFQYFGNINEFIERTSKALSDETLYLKFVQTIPIVGVIGGLSNPIYMNKVKGFAEVKYRKRRLLIWQRELQAAREPQEAPESPDAPEPQETPETRIAIKTYEPSEDD